MPENEGELIPTRHSLLDRLKNWDNSESWQEFFDTYWKLIYGVAIRAGLTDDEAQEVVQETIIHVAKKINGFHYDPARGSFKSWLLQATRWKIADQLRKRRNGAKVRNGMEDRDASTSQLEQIPDPNGLVLEKVWDEEWRKNLTQRALARVKRKVKPKYFQIFDLYVLKGQPGDKVARIVGVGRGQIYLVKHRIASMLKRELDSLEKEAP